MTTQEKKKKKKKKERSRHKYTEQYMNNIRNKKKMNVQFDRLTLLKRIDVKNEINYCIEFIDLNFKDLYVLEYLYMDKEKQKMVSNFIQMIDIK